MNKGRPPISAIQMAPIGTGVTLGVEAKTYCELDRVSRLDRRTPGTTPGGN
jgi:hypothetical protein